jgi:hypothetical protein
VSSNTTKRATMKGSRMAPKAARTAAPKAVRIRTPKDEDHGDCGIQHREDSKAKRRRQRQLHLQRQQC